MNFSYASLLSALSSSVTPDSGSPDEIRLESVDFQRRLGVGRGGDTSYVFVGPGQPRAFQFRTDQVAFSPWTRLVDEATGSTLEDVAVLRAWPLLNEPDAQLALAAIFSGLADLVHVSPADLGDAVNSLRGLFESGLRAGASRESELGVAGELFVIAQSVDVPAMAARWHSRTYETFDFSFEGERLEVKTTASAERRHEFSSGQLDPVPGVCTTYVSVQLRPVSVGSTAKSLFEEVCRALGAEERIRVRRIVMEATRCAPELLDSVVFDARAARGSLLQLPPDAVPAPVPTAGVESMRWVARLPETVADVPASCAFARLIAGREEAI
ncbi:MAG: PD-(D/E)XK motif protein [Acidimicrobiia bacterium]